MKRSELKKLPLAELLAAVFDHEKMPQRFSKMILNTLWANKTEWKLSGPVLHWLLKHQKRIHRPTIDAYNGAATVLDKLSGPKMKRGNPKLHKAVVAFLDELDSKLELSGYSRHHIKRSLIKFFVGRLYD